MLDSETPGVMSIPRVLATLPTVALSNAFRMPANEVEQLQSRVLPARLLQQAGVTANQQSNYDGAAGNNGNAPVPAFGPFTPINNAPATGNTGNVGQAVSAALESTLQQAIVDGVVANLQG